MRKPWNIVDVPVYSLATYGCDSVNMNICTYVMANSMKPKQYTVAVYHGTHTLDNIKRDSQAVLQLLHQRQIDLVKPLGKRSGRDFNKSLYLEKKQLITTWRKHKVLKDVCAYVSLGLVHSLGTQGDHELCVFEVLGSQTIQDRNILMFQDLVEKGVIL